MKAKFVNEEFKKTKKIYTLPKSEITLTPELLTKELKNLRNNQEFLQWAGVTVLNDPDYMPTHEELVDGYCELIVAYIFYKYPSAEDTFSYEKIQIVRYTRDGTRHNIYGHAYITSDSKYYDGHDVNGVSKIWKLKCLQEYVTDKAKAGKYDKAWGYSYSEIFTPGANFYHRGAQFAYNRYRLPAVIKRTARYDEDRGPRSPIRGPRAPKLN